MNYVAYLRVSTQRQGRSGLGLEAQRKMIEEHIDGTPAAEYIEVETGKKVDRPELAQAIAHAKQIGAILVVAKLDRLARDLRFLLATLDSGIEIKFCDMPGANRFMLSILGAVAEYEAALISQRTKAALAAAKARGRKLGGYRGKSTRPSRKAVVAGPVREQITQLRRDGLSWATIVERLASQGVKPPRGGELTRAQVRRMAGVL